MLKIIDLFFSKISAERFKEFASFQGETHINDDIQIKELEKRDIESQKDKKILEIFFTFDVVYHPNLAKLNIEGKIIAGAEKEEAENIFKEWKKSKKIEDLRVLNTILHKCNLKALQLEEELKLPSHIPLPTLTPKVIEEKKRS